MTKAAMMMLLREKQDKKLEEDRKTAQSTSLTKGTVMTTPPGMGSSSSAATMETGTANQKPEDRSNKKKGYDIQTKELAETKKELHAVQAELNRMKEENKDKTG